MSSGVVSRCAKHLQSQMIIRRWLHRSFPRSTVYRKLDSFEEYDGYAKSNVTFKQVHGSNFAQKHQRPIVEDEEAKLSLIFNPSTYFKVTLLAWIMIAIATASIKHDRDEVREYRYKQILRELQLAQKNQAINQ